MKNLILFLFCLGFSVLVMAQTTPTDSLSIDSSLPDTIRPHVVHLEDGNIIRGRITEVRKKDLTLSFEGNTLNIPIKRVKKVEVNSNKKEHQLPTYLTNPTTHGCEQFLFANTGFGLKQGEIDIRTQYGLFNTVEFGLSDHLSFSASNYLLFVLGAELNFRGSITDHVHLGASLAGIRVLFLEGGSVVIPQINLSIGQPNNFFNVSLGTLIYPSNTGNNKTPMLSLGGQITLRNNWRLILETIMLRDNGAAISPSVFIRRIKRKHRFDFGLISFGSSYRSDFSGSSQFIAARPYIAYGLRLGRKK